MITITTPRNGRTTQTLPIALDSVSLRLFTLFHVLIVLGTPPALRCPFVWRSLPCCHRRRRDRQPPRGRAPSADATRRRRRPTGNCRLHRHCRVVARQRSGLDLDTAARRNHRPLHAAGIQTDRPAPPGRSSQHVVRGRGHRRPRDGPGRREQRVLDRRNGNGANDIAHHVLTHHVLAHYVSASDGCADDI